VIKRKQCQSHCVRAMHAVCTGLTIIIPQQPPLDDDPVHIISNRHAPPKAVQPLYSCHHRNLSGHFRMSSK
jgi:hypothetical protein